MPVHRLRNLIAVVPGLAIVAVLFMAANTAYALPYGAAVTATQLSPNVWNYIIHNTSASRDYRLCEIDIDAPGIDNVTMPSGWEADWSGKDGQAWIGSGPSGEPFPTLDMMGWSSPIEAGQAQGGFEIHFQTGVESAEMSGLWWAVFSGPDGNPACTGTATVECNAVPELSSVVCLGAAVLLLALSASGRNEFFRSVLVVSILLALVATAALGDDDPCSYDASPAGGPAMQWSSAPAPVDNGLPPDYTILPAFPHFWWSFGCYPTCGACMVGYYDLAGFPNMVRYPNGDDMICPVGNSPNDNGPFLKTYTGGRKDDPHMYPSRCAISATENGVLGRAGNGSVDDYVSGAPFGDLTGLTFDGPYSGYDPYCGFAGSPVYWTPHSDDCIADYMGTSIRRWRNNYDTSTSGYFHWTDDTSVPPRWLAGDPYRWAPPQYPYVNVGPSSRPVDGTYGLARYIAIQAGYHCATAHAANSDAFDDVLDYYNRPILGYVSADRGVGKADIKNEIDNGVPVIASVVQLVHHTDPDYWYEANKGKPSHAITVFGYRWLDPPRWGHVAADL